MINQVIQNQQLLLPRSQSAEFAHIPISIPITPEFYTIWKNGPSDTSTLELYRCISTISLTLGELITESQGKTQVYAKSSPSDLVTEVDQGIEILLRTWINTHYPHHKIIGEEGPKDPMSPDDVIWYLDPVDGTNNFVEGSKDVSLHIGCVQYNQPLVCILGLPLHNLYYASHFPSNTIEKIGKQSSPLIKPAIAPHILGTEYMESRQTDSAIFTHLCTSLTLNPLRKKSIGITLGKFLTGEITAFYKPKAKLWDIIAPLGIAKTLYRDDLCTELIYTDAQGQLRTESVFSTSPELCAHLNHMHQAKCHAGLVIAYPATRPDIRDAIKSAYFGEKNDNN
jgi:myo-inositol-1(or 4)-monophosphatase